MHGIAFAELVVFLENASSDENSLLSSDSGTLLNCIRTDWSILESLMAELPEFRAHSEGRGTLLTFQKNIGSALKKACDHDSDAMHLTRAAELLRREMFEKN